MRTFEFNDGKSNKFWNIELDGEAFTVTFGRIGTGGQTQIKEFPSDDKAQAAHDKLVAEKLAKGYVETTAGGAAPPAAKQAAAPAAGKSAAPAALAAAPAGGARSFEFNDGKSNKFWKIELHGKSFTVTYGRVGTDGQTQEKDFPSEDKARAAHDKLIAEKTGKGYVETSSGGGGGPIKAVAPSSGKALENAIFANPDDLGAHAAYADWLIEQGDPRGEFIQVQLALEDEKVAPAKRKELEKREKELLKKHERDWLGPMAPFLLDKQKPETPEWHRPGHPKFTWGRGWLSTLDIPEIFVGLARGLVKTGHARMLRDLSIEAVSYSDMDQFEPGSDIPDDAEDQVGQYPLLQVPAFSNLRRFQFGILQGVEEDMNCHIGGEIVTDLVKKMPRIEELYLLAHLIELKPLFGLKNLENLRVLQVYHVTGEHPLGVLAKNPALGKLTHLLLHPHAWEYDDDEGAYINLAGVKALVSSTVLKSLTHVRLRLNDMGDKGITEIVKSGILKRLKVLDIQGGCVTDAGAAALAACPDLENLEHLNISKNMLTRSGVDALKKTKVNMNAASQYKLPEAGQEDQ
ncbi:MAG: WGR domain-containing protein, partial [Gemmataceae bacterium]